MPISPAYLTLTELSKDSLELVKRYLLDIDLEEYLVPDLIAISNVLLDTFKMTHSTLPADERDALMYEVHTLALSLISDAINQLETLKDQPELTSKTSYTQTIRVLNKLRNISHELASNKADVTMNVELTEEELMLVGIQLTDDSN